MNGQKGFSLIELLIVVVILGIISAVAIPNLLAARRTANEASAVASLRLIHSSQTTYQSTAGNGGFGDLTSMRDAGLIDSTLASGKKSGYLFKVTIGTTPNDNQKRFAAAATPVEPSGIVMSGAQDYGVAAEGLIYIGGIGTITSGSGALTGATEVFNR